MSAGPSAAAVKSIYMMKITQDQMIPLDLGLVELFVFLQYNIQQVCAPGLFSLVS